MIWRSRKTLLLSLLLASIGLSLAVCSALASVEHPDWAKNAVIYEVNLRQYTPEGTFSAFEEHLPRLRQMGVSILWFMPIHPIGEVKRKGTLGSYYSVKDYYGINPEFGNLEDFKKLVSKIHSMGMYVLIDWVANHCAWDNPLIEQHPEWFTRDIHGNPVSPVADWSDVVDFNYSNKDLWRYMIDAMKYWVAEADIDGFRCDVAGMVPLEFWVEARKEIWKIKPVFMLAEWESPEAHKHAFDATYGWELHKLMMRIARKELPASSIGAYLNAQGRSYPANAYRLYFTSNHDENSWHGTDREMFGEGAEAFTVLVLTLDGIPLIYSGQEAGLDKRLAFFEKDQIPWREHHMAEVYYTLANLRKRNRALWNDGDGGRVEWIHTTDDSRVFAFIRRKEENAVFVILNLSDSSLGVRLLGNRFAGKYIQVLPKDQVAEISFTGDEEIDLGAWGYRVLVR